MEPASVVEAFGRVPGGDEASEIFRRAILRAGIGPKPEDPATIGPKPEDPMVRHTTLEVVGANGNPMVENAKLDTHVIYQFNLGGIPLTGPGSNLRMSFGPGAEPTSLNVSMRKLELAGEIPIISVREAEGERNSGYKKGYEISFELPIFDWGGAKVAKAEAVYMQALERAAEVATNALSEVREAYHAYRTNYDIARHYRDVIVPLNKRISEESMLRYNGLLIGVFDLLADTRSQIGSVNSYIETLRDFWIAQGDLEMSLIGKPSLNAATRASVAASGRADH